MHYENKLELEVMFVFWRVMLWSWILLFALILILHEKSLPSYLTFTTSFLVSQLQITNFITNHLKRLFIFQPIGFLFLHLGEPFLSLPFLGGFFLRILISRLSHCCLCPLWALGLPFTINLYIYRRIAIW